MRPVLPLLLLACAPDGGEEVLVSTTGPEHCGEVREDEVWAADLNPHVTTCAVEVVEGATLRIGPGTEIRAGGLDGISVIGGDDPGRLLALGSAEAPVLFTLDGDPEVDSWWYGLSADGTMAEDGFRLEHVIVEYAGAPSYPVVPWGALEAYDGAEVFVEEVLLRGNDGFGFYFPDGAAFAEGSSGLGSSGNTGAGLITVEAAWSVPEDGASLSGNELDAVVVQGSGSSISRSGSWGDLGVPYWASSSHGGTVYIDGTEAEPAILTLEPGVQLYFDSGAGISVGAYGGPAGLALAGTEADPVVLSGWDGSGEETWWDGVGLSDAAVDSACVWEHFRLGYGGAAGWTAGNLVLRGASPTLRNGLIHDSAGYGIDLDGESDPVLENVLFEDNASGDSNAE